MKQKTIEKYAPMRAYKAEGHTAQEVAERFGVSVTAVRWGCKGIAPRGIPSVTDETRGKIKAYREEGHTIQETVETFGVSRWVVQRASKGLKRAK